MSGLKVAPEGRAFSQGLAGGEGGLGTPIDGDVGGTLPGGTVVEAIQGVPVSPDAPATNDVLTFDGTEWRPAPSAGSGSPVEVLDEGGSLTAALASLDFTGAGVTATVVGDAVTVNVPGATAIAEGTGRDVTPPLSIAIPAWVKPTGSGVITADPQGRITVDSGATYKAFPGMAFLEGVLHLVYRDASAHNSAGGVVKYRTSKDLGRTWSSAASIATPAGSDDNRDPTIVALSSGRLLLAYHRTGTGGTIALDMRVRYSDNRGITWSSEYTVPDTFSGEVAGAGTAIELPDGTILLPGYGESGGNFEVVVWRSTDGGLTFGSQTTVAASGSRNYYELQIRYLSSGNIVGLIRSSGAGHTWRTVSTDAGATWSAATDVLTAGLGPPNFVEFYPGALLLFIREASGDDDLRWAVSWDEGATWTALQEVDAGETADSMYAAPVVLAPGYVVVAYSLENSGSDADLFLRWYFDGYGTDPLGQARAKWLQVDEQTAPATPPSGKGVFYAGTDGKPYFKDDAGVASDLTATGTNGSSANDHAHVVAETHTSDGATTTFTLDEAYVPDSVAAYNLTSGLRLGVVEVAPDQATISAAGTAGNQIIFDYAAATV